MRTALAVGGLVVAAAGMGGCELTDPGTNVVNGKRQFLEKCASCHVLQRAGAEGITGPNLDQAFARARADGFGESTFAGVVREQIAHPNRNPSRNPATGEEEAPMPADLVTGEDAEDVAAYVAAATARSGEDEGRLAQVTANQAEGTAEAENGTLEIPADPNGALAYTFADAKAPPGPLTITSPNDAAIDHNIAVEGGGVDEVGPVVANGGVSELEVDLRPGEYTFYCSVPGHRVGGMEGTLTVGG